MDGKKRMVDITQVQAYINELLLSKDVAQKSIICKSFNLIAKLNSDEIHPFRYKLAELFCVCSSRIDDSLAAEEDVSASLIQAFENIKTSELDNINSSDLDNSDLLTLHFLSQVHDLSSDSNNPMAQMQHIFAKLCEKLDMMHSLFRIREKGEIFFPIGKLLDFVIDSETFFTENLDEVTLNTFLLALEVFDSIDADKKNKIKKLIAKCNLECLRLLNRAGVSKVGGSQGWRENFKKNGSLVFLVPDKDSFKIFIRHNDKSYFSSENNDVKLEYEKNATGNVIAYYTYICKSGKLDSCDINNLMQKKNLEDLEKLCIWIFSERKMNIFLDNSFIKIDGKWSIANPFVANDQVIVSTNPGSLYANFDNLIKVFLAPYSFFRIGCGFDFIIYKSIFLLLKTDSKPIKAMFDFLKDSKSKELQSGLINIWAENIDDYDDKFAKISADFFSSVNYAKKQSEISKKKINEISWLPYYFPFNSIDLYLEKKYQYNKVSDKVFFITADSDFLDTVYVDENGNRINKDCFESNDEDLKSIGSFYVIKKSGVQKYSYNQEIDKLLRLKKVIQKNNENLAEFEKYSIIEKTEIDQVIHLMRLHEYALVENCLCNDFESVAYIRLFHHLLYCQIIKNDKWKSFLKLMLSHKEISFCNIRNDLSRYVDENTLVVPKEHQNTDNTFVLINNQYIRLHSVRNINLFERKLVLDKRKQKYCLENGKEINKIAILFDTLQLGKSTIGVLSMYFNRKYKGNKICKFYCGRKRLFLEDILNQNNASLEIISLYASLQGKKNVDKFICSSNNILNRAKEVLFIHKITEKADVSFIKLMHDVYPNADGDIIKEGDIPIIREFNQPKKNVFPKLLLEPSCIASIFVKKEELSTRLS